MLLVPKNIIILSGATIHEGKKVSAVIKNRKTGNANGKATNHSSGCTEFSDFSKFTISDKQHYTHTHYIVY